MEWLADIAEIDQFFPAQRDEALAALRASKSKKAAEPAAALVWKWNFGVVFTPSALSTGAVAAIMANAIKTQAANGMAGLAAPALPAGTSVAAKQGKSGAKKSVAQATKAGPSEEDLAETSRETNPRAYCEAHLKTNFRLTLQCAGHYYSSPIVHRAPESLVERYAVKPSVPVAPALALSIYSDRKTTPPGRASAAPGEILQEAVDGMYRKDDELYAVLEGNFFLEKLDIEHKTAGFSGSLRSSARSAYQACAPGGVFKHRNKPLQKLSMEEVKAILAETPLWAQGWPASLSGLVGERPQPTINATADTLVFAPGAQQHPNPKPLGTAAGLGLLAQASATSTSAIIAKKAKKSHSPR